MSKRRRAAGVLGALALSCGGPPNDRTPPVLGRERSPEVLPLVQTPDRGVTPATVAAVPPPPPGSNGPADAIGILGDAGRIFPADPTAVLLVNSAALRAHPQSRHARQILTIVLAAWNELVPTALVDPVRDVDWVVASGTLAGGSTRNGVAVAKLNLSGKKTDAVSAELVKRLPGAKRTQLGVAGVTSFSAAAYREERAYVRPKPSVLAIVPVADAKRAAEALAKSDLAPAMRAGELARMAWPRAADARMPTPPEIAALRVWINAAPTHELTIVAEGVCGDEAAARAAVDALRPMLSAHAGPPSAVRTQLRPVIDDAAIWADGKVVRYEAKLPDALVDLVAGSLCGLATGNRDCAP